MSTDLTFHSGRPNSLSRIVYENRRNHLRQNKNRPRFKMFTHLTKEEYADNLKKYLAEHKKNFPAISIKK
jgi:hypothetical protein